MPDLERRRVTQSGQPARRSSTVRFVDEVVETPTDPTLLETSPPNHRRQDTPTADEGGWMVGAP